MSKVEQDAFVVDDIEWRIKHGGGDDIADKNCWELAKNELEALLEVAEAARVYRQHVKPNWDDRFQHSAADVLDFALRRFDFDRERP